MRYMERQNADILSRRAVLRAAAGLTAISAIGCQTLPSQSLTGAAGKFISINGNRIYVEDRGAGIPIVMAAGGLNQVETLRPLAEKLATQYRVITWDRANLGRSDVVFSGARDLDMWSDQLSGLISHLGLRPAYLIGASSAARVAYTTALRYPDHTRGLLTYLTTGGGGIEARLAERYYYSNAKLALEGGMAAIASSDYFAERIAANRDNKARLLAMNPRDFAATMRRWGTAMESESVMIGLDAHDCAKLKSNGTPIAITQGCEGDDAHRRDRSELYARLTGARLIPTPSGYCEELTTGIEYGTLMTRPEVPESPPFRAYEMMSSIPGVIDDFITQTEAGYAARGLNKDAVNFNPTQVLNQEG